MNTPLLPARATLTYASLFSGIGGFDLGFDRAGMHCVTQVEFDPKAAAVLEYHWPAANRLKDVRDVRSLGTVDLVCGGFPCQDVSVAGRRAGLAGERSGLWFEFYRIIKEHSPRWVVIENVPGLLTSNRGRDFAAIVNGLVQCGYSVCWRVLDAQYFGVAQRRRRVFIVASLGTGRSAEVLFERESGGGDSSPCSTQGKAAAGSAGNSFEAVSFRWNYHGYSTEKSETILTDEKGSGSRVYVHKPATIYTENGFECWQESVISSTLNAHLAKEAHALITFNSEQTPKAARNVRLTLRGEYQGARVNVSIPSVVDTTGYQGDRVISPDGIWPTLSAESCNNGGGANALALAPVSFTWQSSNQMSVENDMTPTMRSTHGGPLAGQQAAVVRRLTPTECERLQGFPDGWTAVNDQADSTRYKQLGNAVCVNVSEWIGRRIVQVDRRPHETTEPACKSAGTLES